MTTPSDYAGRTVDVMAFQGVRPERSLLAQSLYGGGYAGTVCAGAQKLAQRWLLCLLTPSGSARFRADEGTDFLAEVRSGQLRSEADVYQSFAAAARQAQRLLEADEADADPDDERLASAELTRAALEPGLLTLEVRLLSRAGVARKILLPLPLTFTVGGGR